MPQTIALAIELKVFGVPTPQVMGLVRHWLCYAQRKQDVPQHTQSCSCCDAFEKGFALRLVFDEGCEYMQRARCLQRIEINRSLPSPTRMTRLDHLTARPAPAASPQHAAPWLVLPLHAHPGYGAAHDWGAGGEQRKHAFW